MSEKGKEVFGVMVFHRSKVEFKVANLMSGKEDKYIYLLKTIRS